MKFPVFGSWLFWGDGGQILTCGGSMLPGSAGNWFSFSNSTCLLWNSSLILSLTAKNSVEWSAIYKIWRNVLLQMFNFISVIIQKHIQWLWCEPESVRNAIWLKTMISTVKQFFYWYLCFTLQLKILQDMTSRTLFFLPWA